MARELAVWKFDAPIEDKLAIELPERAKILSVQAQGDGAPKIWALCETSPNCPKEERHFIWVGTGHGHPPSFWKGLEYVATVQLQKGALVFHLFEEKAEEDRAHQERFRHEK